MRRFSANKARSKQATSRIKLIEKLKPDDVKPSSRQNPYIRFEYDPKQKLHRHAVEVEGLAKGWNGLAQPLFTKLSFLLEAGQRLAIVGPNGAGKTTLLRTLIGDLAPDRRHGEMGRARDDRVLPAGPDQRISTATCPCSTGWRGGSDRSDDEQIVRATLGRLLFSGDETAKSVRVLSGGERGRMLFGKLMLQEPNVLVMDEPTNHMDMESIESLQLALEKYAGTLIVVSHDRQFVSALATEVIELGGVAGPVHFDGTYEDYLGARGLA